MSAMAQEVIIEPGTSPIAVDGSAVTQPISVSSLPLPTGAATETTLASINTKTPALVGGRQPVDGSGVTQPVSIAASVAVTGPLTDTQLRATPVPVSGSVSTTPVVSSSSTITQITSTGANQTVLAANVNRKKAILFFSSGIWNVKFGATASASSRTLQVSTSGFYLEVPTWTGIIDVLCTTAGKLVDVTELV